MHVRAKEHPPLCFEDKEQVIRKKELHRTMHGTSINEAGTVEQRSPIGQQLFALIQFLVATQSRYAGIEKHVLAIVGENRVHIAQVQELLREK